MYLFLAALEKVYMRPSVHADKMAVVVHSLDYLLPLFDLSAHQEEACLDVALTQAVKKLLGVLARAVVKGECDLLFAA